MEADYTIIRLVPADFEKCGNIWNMDRQSELAERFYREILQGNRATYVFQIGQEYVGEISLVFDMNDPNYTIEKQRAYISRLIVKRECRRKGIGKKLLAFAVETARDTGYSELSVGVDLDNYPALKLYVEAGFRHVLFIGEDAGGKYVKLLMKLQ